MSLQHPKETTMRYLFITLLLLLCCTFAPPALAQPSIFDVVGRGELEVIQEAFNSWADPNATDENDQSILIQAVSMNRLDIANVLLDVNADVNFQNSLGQTALLTAIVNARPDPTSGDRLTRRAAKGEHDPEAQTHRVSIQAEVSDAQRPASNRVDRRREQTASPASGPSFTLWLSRITAESGKISRDPRSVTWLAEPQ
ncbi:MAG: ankyrin repeat domain-containing protein [Deinococcota bacterium]